MRQPGAARHAELQFSARANAITALLVLTVTALTWRSLHDVAIVTVQLAIVSWCAWSAHTDAVLAAQTGSRTR